MDFRYELLMHRYTHPETGVSINHEDMPWELKPYDVASVDAGQILPGYLPRVGHLDVSRLQKAEVRWDRITAGEAH